MKNKEAKKGSRISQLGCIFVLIFFVLTGGTIFILEIPFFLCFGWILYLKEVLPKISWTYDSFILPPILFVLFVWGTHRLLTWFYENYVWSEVLTRSWSWKWSAIGVTAFLLMFVTSIALIGMLHQLVWLLREPLLEEQGLFYQKRAQTQRDMRQIQVAFTVYKEKFASFPVTSGTVELNEAILPEEIWAEFYKDRWESPYRYTSNGTSYTLRSYGKNKILGGSSDEDEFDDILLSESGFIFPLKLEYPRKNK